MTDAASDLDRRVGAFEAAWASGRPPDPAHFLPPESDPQFLPVLAELIRVDLEFRRRGGEAARLDGYRATFPALFAEASLVRELAFEEYRLRARAGERTHPREYAARYGIDTSGWPPPQPSEAPTEAVPDLGLNPSRAGEPGPHFPEPGETILDFRLVAELGRGSFGRTYLAEQVVLAGRRVAVKLSTRFGKAEPETLARLQHTHVVPVYSTHRAGPFQVVVMPFLGSTTLADLLGSLRGRRAWPSSGRDLVETLAGRKSETQPGSTPANHDKTTEPPDRPAADAAVVLRTLARFSFTEAVLWIGARLADALAHAHDRGILHRDVKPANVLLTDDGEPMLLDFNLAVDAQGRPRGAGGTPAYGAPEQLRAMRGGAATVDGRADTYGLGVVLFELLTGRHPSPPPSGTVDPIPELLRLRLGPPPRLRTLNPAVSPAAEAIVRRCLEADPARRYPSARALAEDLDRQLAHQPLRHTREPSIRERLTKWRRRNPRLAASVAVAAIAAAVLVPVGSVAVARHLEARRLEAEKRRLEVEQAAEKERAERLKAEQAAAAQLRAFRTEARTAVPLMAIHGHDLLRRRDGEARVRALLARYAVIEDPDWRSRPAVALLPEADRAGLREQVTEMLLLLARVGADRAMGLPPAERNAALVACLTLIDRAASEYEPGTVPRALWADRAEVLTRLGRTDEANRLRETELQAAPVSARDLYLSGTALLARGHYREAAKLLEQATARDPRLYWAWFGLGWAHVSLGRDAQAEGCFNACVALEPDFPMAYFNRGLARLRRNLFAPAEADFTIVLRLQPDYTDALVNRALARLGMGRAVEAEADLTRAIGPGTTQTRLYFLRADARERARDKPGAEADRAAGLTRTPADDLSWVARGLAKADTDAAGAVADFDEALKLNPRCFPALQNKAYVLSEKLNRPDDAIAVLGQAIELFPDELLARAGRAVLLARKGERAAALRDAEHCLKQGPGPDVLYQLAGVYALTSKQHPEDARTAFRLLSDALRQGYGFDLVAIDPDLEPLRSMPEFRLVVDAAKAVRPRQSGQ
jgi:serine/threonine protein kinase/Flp pilus assembly protein TadD